MQFNKELNQIYKKPMTYPIEGTATTFVDDSRPMVHFAEQRAPSGFLQISRFSLCYRVEVR